MQKIGTGRGWIRFATPIPRPVAPGQIAPSQGPGATTYLSGRFGVVIAITKRADCPRLIGMTVESAQVDRVRGVACRAADYQPPMPGGDGGADCRGEQHRH
jgi:hypothetical protein